MLHYPRWKTLSILAAVLIGVVLALPNVVSREMQDWLRTYNLRPVTLGLDLQGGSNVLLEVDRTDLKDKLTQQLVGDIRSTLREAQIGYAGINRSDTGVSVRITKPEDLDRARTELQKLLQPVETGLFGTGIQANLVELSQQDQHFTLSFSEAGIDSKIASAISQSLKIVESRVNALGTAEPVIQQQGKDRIVVQLPGVQNPDQVKSVIGRTAKLTFQLLCEAQANAPGQAPPPECKELPVKPDPGNAEVTERLWVQTSSRATVDGADLVDARPAFDQQNQPIVSFRFNTKGAERFAKLTRDNVGKPFAIILDDEIVSYPRINEPILGGSGQISGKIGRAHV